MIKDAQLASILPSISRVGTYTSPEIQNELIALFAKMVQENIAEKCIAADVEYYTLKMDGTTDAIGIENISIVVRFVKLGHVKEHLLKIATTSFWKHSPSHIWTPNASLANVTMAQQLWLEKREGCKD